MTTPTWSAAGDPGTGVATPETETREKTRLCPMHKVFLHNDDVTPMEFVVGILVGIFHLEGQKAVNVMFEAHHRGVAFVAAYPLEQAEFRCDQAHSKARGRGYPLTLTYEPE